VFIGFPYNLLIWLSDYLTNRTQNVVFRSAISRPISVASGVPQGSYLGPLLFNLFNNDLPYIILHSNILMYADDEKLCLSLMDSSYSDLLQADVL